ncbi:MAG: LysR family transcriptional regulator [Novosphingobium sp. 17-62-8]|nr:MAG: LysR family transcriptional regulator [Novosphingobium sp. 17-62-8]
MHKLAIYHLETLLWIARLGTFRAAAERLHTTQPAISARVREIEGQLGLAIFRREGRGVVLTARGRQLVQDCEPLLAGLESALLEAGNHAGAAGVVRIAAGEIATATCLPQFAGSVRKDLPGVTLHIDLDLTARMLQNLLSGTRDIAFLAGPVASPGLRTEPIGEVKLVWLASPAIASDRGLHTGIPIWSVGEHSPIHRVTCESLQAAGLPVRAINTCNNVQTMLGIVANGAGAAVFPETMARRLIKSGDLVECHTRPNSRIRFEVAVRSSESDPVVLELFRRASALSVT